MRPRRITRHTALRLLLGACLGTLLLAGCKEWQSPGSPKTSQLSGQWVDIESLYREPEKFVDRGRLRFYLTEVHGDTGQVKDALEPLLIYSRDSRSRSTSVVLDILLTSKARNIWTSAQLAESHKFLYGVTFSGHLRPAHPSTNSWYKFVVDDLDINDETSSYAAIDPKKLRSDYRPTELLPLPRPLIVSDTRRMSLLPSDYIGRKVQFELYSGRNHLEAPKNGVPRMLYDDLSLQLNDQMVRQLLDAPSDLARTVIIGRVLKQRDADGRLQVTVESLELKPI